MLVEKDDRSGERQQRPGTPRERIHHGEIACPIAAEQAVGVEKMEHTGREQKKRGPQTQAGPGVRQDPEREGRKHDRFGGRGKPDQMLAMGCPLGQKIPGGMRERGERDKKKCGKWQDPPKEKASLPETRSRLSTFPSGIFALGCGPPGPLWRLDRLITGTLATSFHRIRLV